MDSSKRKRQEKILQIIERMEIETQEELAEILRESGAHVTQATVSRDIREMRLSKIQTPDGRQKYVQAGSADRVGAEKYIRLLRDSYLHMDKAQNILVIKTSAGMAMAAAAALDALHLPDVVGCIAGDDTIFAAIRSAEETEAVMDRLRSLLEG